MSLLLALLNNGVTGTITAAVVVSAASVGVVPVIASADASAGANASCTGVVPVIGQSSASVGQSCECAGLIPCSGSVAGLASSTGQCVGVVAVVGAVSSALTSSANIGGVVAIVGDVASFAAVQILIRGKPPTLSYPLSASVSDRSASVLLSELDASASVSQPYAQFVIGDFAALAVVFDSKTGVE